MSELSKTARKVAFRSANEALRRDLHRAELLDALRALRDATAAALPRVGPSDRAAIEPALAKAERALANGDAR